MQEWYDSLEGNEEQDEYWTSLVKQTEEAIAQGKEDFAAYNISTQTSIFIGKPFPPGEYLILKHSDLAKTYANNFLRSENRRKEALSRNPEWAKYLP